MSWTSTWTSVEEEKPPARVEVIVMHERGEMRRGMWFGEVVGWTLENLYGKVLWWMPKTELPPRDGNCGGDAGLRQRRGEL